MRTDWARCSQQAAEQCGVRARRDRQKEIGILRGAGLARIDDDELGAALAPVLHHALEQNRMAPGGVRSDQHQEIGLIEIFVIAGHGIRSEGAAMAGDRRRHAKPRIGVDICAADEALHQLVGDVIVFRQQLPGQIEGDRIRSVALDDALEAVGRRGRAPDPSLIRAKRAVGSGAASGVSSRSSSDSVSPSAVPFEHSLPKLAGCDGSPAIAAPPLPSGAASTPQPTPQ